VKRTLNCLGVVLLGYLCTTRAAAPERQVEYNRVISRSDPEVTIEVPRSATYVGADRFDLYGLADCEIHVFAEAVNKRVTALYWIQFEALLPSQPTSQYAYWDDELVTISGMYFNRRTHFGPSHEPQRAASDHERVRQLLERAGYELPTDIMSVRLVHLTDETYRKELMIVYIEDLAATGYTSAQLMDGDTPVLAWEGIRNDFLRRAQKRIRISDWRR
jgi:hypothetical protein